MLVATTLVASGACDPHARADDTTGEQSAARWEWYGQLAMEADSVLTVTRIRIDSGLPERHDVLLVRYEFDPAYGTGDEYALTVGLDLGVARELPMAVPLELGPRPGGIPAVATVACVCRPLRPDSVRGTLTINQRGVRQITARIDATLYFTAWLDSTTHVSYALRQKLYGVR